MPTTAALPDYEPLLAAYHRAFAVELRAMVACLPIREGDRVVELACGDGAYSPWLAHRVGPSGVVVAVDVSPAYLRVARAVSSTTAFAARVAHVAALWSSSSLYPAAPSTSCSGALEPLQPP